MEDKKHSEKFLRKRRFLMVLPMLIIPFITIMFAALGGGKGSSSTTGQINGAHGLNPELPNAHFKRGEEKDKMAFYEEAGKDSAKIIDAIKKDPYYKKDSTALKNPMLNNHNGLESIFENSASKYSQGPFSKLKTSVNANEDSDANTKKVMDKIAQLKAALKNKPESVPTGYPTNNDNAANPDIEKLQRLMNSMKQNNNNPSDPELNQINGMLDKIMNIQHPEKLQDSMRKISERNKPQSFSVSTNADVQPDSSVQNGFYGLSEENINDEKKPNAIEAVIEEDQTLVSGAVVKLRLLQDIYVHGMRIAKDQLVYGISSLSNERLKIAINSVRSNDNIVLVSLEAYDMDGLAGIYVPGSIDRDVSKQSADEAISTIGLTTFDPSIGAQAASAGIQAAKTLMSKKIKLVRVSVKAGYKVLLKDNNQK